MMDENLETKGENMKNEMTHSSIVQLLEILKLCNFLDALPHGIVAKILGKASSQLVRFEVPNLRTTEYYVEVVFVSKINPSPKIKVCP
jgi:hypothetical protein